MDLPPTLGAVGYEIFFVGKLEFTVNTNIQISLNHRCCPQAAGLLSVPL